jgi:hypothetical protein
LVVKAGREKAKDFLLKWWVRFDDVNWKNLERKEALFASWLIHHWFGGRIFDMRRSPYPAKPG